MTGISLSPPPPAAAAVAAADVDVLLAVRPSFLAAESLIPAIRHVHRVVHTTVYPTALYIHGTGRLLTSALRRPHNCI